MNGPGRRDPKHPVEAAGCSRVLRPRRTSIERSIQSTGPPFGWQQPQESRRGEGSLRRKTQEGRGNREEPGTHSK